jgi:hypothetical protein
MRNTNKIVLVAATFLLAAATGQLMQRDSAPDIRPAPVAALPLHPSVAMIAVSDAPGEVVSLPALPDRRPAADLGLTRAASAADVVYDDYGRSCAAPSLTLTPGAQATLTFALAAPCYPDATVTLRHETLVFAIRTDAQGRFTGTLPALARDVRLEALLPGNERLAAISGVQGLEALNRVVVLANAPDLALNAFEYGAEFGSLGHVRADTPRAPDTALGGYLTLLGDPAATPPALAQVYTAPAGMGDVTLELDAALTPETCDRDLRATLLRVLAGRPEARGPLALTLAMPACDGVEGAVLLPLPGMPVALAAADQR